MPDYKTVPPATGEPAKLNPENTREAPPAPGAAPAVSGAKLVEGKLSNGIPLVTAQTGSVPIATITVVLPGGNATDPAGKAGLASLAAAVADKGTPTRSATEIAATLEGLGASMGASAGNDGVYVSLTAPTANLAEAGKVLADVIRNADYPAAELDRERKRTIDGLQIALKDPGSLGGLIATRVLYGGAPYGTFATVASLPRITREDLAQWRAKWWHPATAKVLVSGGIDAAQAQALTESLFGNWSSTQAAPVPPAEPAGAAQPVRTLVIDMPEAGQAAVIAGVRAPARSSADYFPLVLANAVLGAGSNGRLFEEVRTKRGLSYGSYSGFGSSADDSVLTASAQTKNESADEVAQVILDQFSRLGTEPADAASLEKRRLFLGGSNARALETSGGFNAIVANLLLQGLPPEEAARYAERLTAVSPDMAADVARRLVTPEGASLIVVGNAAAFLDDLRKIRPDVQVIKASELDLDSATLTPGGG